MNRFDNAMGVCMQGDATPKQIEYAKAIHDLIGAELPAEKTKQAYGDFIDRHVSTYKMTLREMRLAHEAHMEAIDAGRDW